MPQTLVLTFLNSLNSFKWAYLIGISFDFN